MTTSITFAGAMEILNEWIGLPVSLFVTKADSEYARAAAGAGLRGHASHGVLRLTDLGPQREDASTFALVASGREPDRSNDGGLVFGFLEALFQGAEWVAGCEGTVLRVRQGSLEYEFVRRTDA